MRVLLSLSAWMIEYDADLVSDSLLTHSAVRKRLERCERKEGRGEEERERVRDGEKEMKECRCLTYIVEV